MYQALFLFTKMSSHFIFDLLPQYKLLVYCFHFGLCLIKLTRIPFDNKLCLSLQFLLPLMSFSWHKALTAFSSDVPSLFQICCKYPFDISQNHRTMRGEFTWLRWCLNRLKGLPEGSHHLDSNHNDFYSIYVPIQLWSPHTHSS